MTHHYWIGVVHKDHVAKGVKGGFAQLDHGKKSRLEKVKAGDWLVYYSPRPSFESKTPLQSFTAIGRIKTGEVYRHDMGTGFVPYRTDVDFRKCEIALIRPLLEKLSFAEGKKNWGQQMRLGHFEITKRDFDLIAKAMKVRIK